MRFAELPHIGQDRLVARQPVGRAGDGLDPGSRRDVQDQHQRAALL